MVVVVAVIALVALAIGFVLRREVLAAGQGTAKMQEIGQGGPGGRRAPTSTASSTRSASFIVVVFVLLFALPADSIG